MLLALGAGVPGAEGAETDPHAVVLIYHHVSNKTPASTSVAPAEFESHLDYLAEHGYTVLPLAEIIAALRDRTPLPPRAVALTFDDAYASVYTEAMPRLARRGWPFTVFVTTDYIDDAYAGYMSWDQLREAEARGGAVGNHTVSHAHLIRRLPGEDRSAWARRVSAEIRGAQSRLKAELAEPLEVLAYPYGEFDGPLRQLVADLGYVAFGQQSGPVGPDSGPQQLPRFPVAEGYAGIDSLAEKLRSRPLPVTVLAPGSRVLPPGAGPPVLRLRIPQGPYRRGELRCYVSRQAPATVEWRGDVATIAARERLQPGRSKFNCTAPSSAEHGVYYWYSFLWIEPREDGSWYRG
jgi:biofilm PGA synthesis lipoprotein PgaB